MTGTRPSAASTTRSTTVRRSSAVRLPASPIVPVATKPCTPASSSALEVGLQRGDVDLVGGGERGGDGGDDAFEGHSGELHVGADAGDVLGRVEARRLRRRPRRSPRRSCGARPRGSGCGRASRSSRRAAAATAARPSAPRRGRRTRAGPGCRSWPRAGGGSRRSEAFQVAGRRVDRIVAASIAVSRFSTAGSALRAARRPARATAGSSCARASSTADGLASCVRRVASRRLGGDERPAPGRVSTTPRSCSAASASRTDARLTSSARASSRSDGSRSPGASSAGADVGREPLGDLLVALERPESRQVCFHLV